MPHEAVAKPMCRAYIDRMMEEIDGPFRVAGLVTTYRPVPGDQQLVNPPRP